MESLVLQLRIAEATLNLGLESSAHETCGRLLGAYHPLLQEGADTCTSEPEAGSRTFELGADTHMPEPEAGTSTSGPGADIRKSERAADTHVSQVEAGRHIPAEAADRGVQAVGGLDVAGRCSIAVARRPYMLRVVSGHSNMTSLVRLKSRLEYMDKRCAITCSVCGKALIWNQVKNHHLYERP